MSSEDLRQQIGRLGTSCYALVAVATALQAKVGEMPLDTDLQFRVEEVLTALGMSHSVRCLSADETLPILAGIRTDLLVGAKAIDASRPKIGWTYVEADLLQSTGDVSSGFPLLLRTRIGPQLDGLLDRLGQPTAAFLDVGAGVASLSIAMVRQWPSLSVVGIDPWPPSIAIGRKNVQGARLAQKIELREANAEDLMDRDAFDLGWIPSLFIPQSSIAKIVERVSRALRPGAWLLLPIVNFSDDPLVEAIARFRTALWGGCQIDAKMAEELMTRAGLLDLRLLAGPPGSPIAIAAGRRPKV